MSKTKFGSINIYLQSKCQIDENCIEIKSTVCFPEAKFSYNLNDSKLTFFTFYKKEKFAWEKRKYIEPSVMYRTIHNLTYFSNSHYFNMTLDFALKKINSFQYKNFLSIFHFQIVINIYTPPQTQHK